MKKETRITYLSQIITIIFFIISGFTLFGIAVTSPIEPIMNNHFLSIFSFILILIGLAVAIISIIAEGFLILLEYIKVSQQEDKIPILAIPFGIIAFIFLLKNRNDYPEMKYSSGSLQKSYQLNKNFASVMIAGMIISTISAIVWIFMIFKFMPQEIIRNSNSLFLQNIIIALIIAVVMMIVSTISSVVYIASKFKYPLK